MAAGTADGSSTIQNGVVASKTAGHRLVVFAVTLHKAYGHDKGDPFGQTTYRF